MIFGSWIDATITYLTDDDLTPQVDLLRDWELLQIVIPPLGASANVSFEVAEKTGGTFQALGSGSQVIAAATGAISTVVRLGGWQFIKVKTSAAQTANRTFRVRGARS